MGGSEDRCQDAGEGHNGAVMEYAKLNNTDLVTSRVAFGCEPLGGSDWGPLDEEEAMEAVRRAVDLGVNFFDTADVYGLGRSEELLGRALGPQRNDVIIATKVGLNWENRPGATRARTSLDSSPRRIVEALENSLRRLRVDCIPLYLVHWPDPRTPIVDTMTALNRCREAGKIKHIGVSNFPAGLIREAHRVSNLAAVELPYSVIDRRVEADTLPCCLELAIGVLAYGTLAQGLLTGKYGPGARFGQEDRRHRLPHFHGASLIENLKTVDRLRQIGERYGKSPSQVAIRWVLEYPAVSSAITGAKSLAQIENNVGASGWSLTERDRQYIATGAALVSSVRTDS